MDHSSFRTYRGQTIADINGNPQSNFPQMRLGVLAGRRWPPKLRPSHLCKSADLIMAARGAEHDADRRGFRSNPSRRMQGAEHASKTTVEINSGQLHREVGGYPGQNHRMPMCCAVMRSEMSAVDAILREPPKKQGASLTIRYKLPRC